MKLGELLQTYIAARKTSLRKLSPAIGVHYTSLHRFCTGKPISGQTFGRLLTWCFTETTKARNNGKAKASKAKRK